MGRKTRSGPVRAFRILMGPRWAWMGAFVAFVAAAIMFYYSVVAGWTLRYTVAAVSGEVPGSRPGAFWEEFTGSWWPVLTHGAAIGLATFVVGRGVRVIERVAKVLMPTLLVLLVVLAVRAVTLPNASAGLGYLFSVDWEALGSAKLWLEALTQNAWDTGAGWGLVLCYAAYLREREDTTLNAFILPSANNAISLIAGIMVICTVASVTQLPADALASSPALSANHTGLTFTWMPQLFETLWLGRVFMTLFFSALAFAAFTSLMAMVELATRVLVDAGIARRTAVSAVGAGGFILGMPSALSLDVLNNQDGVWGVALMLAGLFFALAVAKHGVARFRKEELNHADSNIRIGPWWDFVILVVVPVEAVVLLSWWLFQAWQGDPDGWLNPFAVFNVGTVVTQIVVVLVVLIAGNRWIAKTTDNPNRIESP